MEVLWVTNIPSPYRVDFFNELGKLCELTVLFEKSTSSERDKSWNKQNFLNFNGIVLNGRSTAADKAICFDVLKYLDKNKFEHIIITSIATPTGILAIEYMKLLKIPYIIEGDGGFAKNGKGFKENFKRHLIKGAKGYFSTAACHDNYYLKYGARRSSIFRYPFTSLKNEDILTSPIPRFEKQNIKIDLGISEEKIVLTVGQMIHRKGYDILLKACNDISKDVGIYIIGGQPTEYYLNLKQELNLTNVHFVDFKTKDKLRDYFKMADLFVLPTREDIWGLVINEAMAFGLPIITTDRCVAGLELVVDNSNGYIISVEDQEMLSQKINYILNDDLLRENMGRRSLENIKNYTIENMASRHIEVLEGLNK